MLSEKPTEGSEEHRWGRKSIRDAGRAVTGAIPCETALETESLTSEQTGKI